MLTISLNILDHIYKNTQLSVDNIYKQTALISNYIYKYDTCLYNLLGRLPADEVRALLFKQQASCCLHSTTSLCIGIELTMVALSTNQDVQAFVIQQIFSVAFRATQERPLPGDTYALGKKLGVNIAQLSVKKINADFSGESDIKLVVSSSISHLLVQDNYAALHGLIANVIKHYSKYQLQENLKLAGIVGAGVLATIGLVAGILAASITAGARGRR